jgi:hypothetical protein
VSWTYSGNPSTSVGDQVRFLVEDTDPNEQLLSDEEIAYLLQSVDGKPYTAAAQGLWQVWVKLSRQADSSVGDVHKVLSRRAEHFEGLYREMQRRARAVEGSSIFDGSIDGSLLIDGDAVDASPYFRGGQMDNPWAGNYSTINPSGPGLIDSAR